MAISYSKGESRYHDQASGSWRLETGKVFVAYADGTHAVVVAGEDVTAKPAMWLFFADHTRIR